MSVKLIRRDLSGIYIFDKFPTDEKRKPTCVEDCTPSKRREWCMSKDCDYLRNVIKIEADTFLDMTEYCLKEKCVTEEQATEFRSMMANIVDRSKWNWALHELADQVDFVCEKVRLLADAVGITKHIYDDDMEE